MNKPLIGLTCSRDILGTNNVQYVHEDYIEAIDRMGGIPIILPICDEKDIEDQVHHIDGLLVTGGIDVNPLFYHGTYHHLQGESDAKRDFYEITLIKEAASLYKPVLGICRGIQIINVAFEGTLYQDNSLIDKNILQHVQRERKEYPSHLIEIEKNSFLASILGDIAYVNSFHHQSIHTLAKGFKIVAKSVDNVIEAIEHTELPIYAVQFHPEKMKYDVNMSMIFKNFIEKCNQSQR